MGAITCGLLSVKRWLGVLLLATLGGCAVSFLSTFDQQAVDRTASISKSSLAVYQQLLETPLAKRQEAVKGALRPKYGEIETQIRVHLLQEQSRNKNEDSVTIATNLLKSWQEFEKGHQAAVAGDLTDARLNIERGILERHLRSAFIAEESKKLGAGAAKS